MFSKMRSPISHYWYMLFALTRCVSTMTKYLPLSNCAISNLHVSKVVFVLPYRPADAQLGPGTLASRHWSRYCWKLVRPCKNHLYVGSPAVPDLRLVRNILRRRRKGIQFGLRLPRRHRGRREIDYSLVWKRTMELQSRRVRFLERIVWKRM
jgi:hypothetical protein